MRTIKRRLTAAEHQLGRQHVRHIVIIAGGLPGEISFARAGGFRWQRGMEEPCEAFEKRVKADPKMARTNLIVFGGLPDGHCSMLPPGSTPEKPEGDNYDEVPPEEVNR